MQGYIFESFSKHTLFPSKCVDAVDVLTQAGLEPDQSATRQQRSQVAAHLVTDLSG